MTQTPNFKNMMKGISSGEIVVPLLRSALYDPDFKAFDIRVEGFTNRKPTEWFSPSTHPGWPEPALYTYLAHPERLVREPFDPSSTFAVTVGTFFHQFTQHVLVENGVITKQPLVCGCGVEHPERAELYLVDEELKVRGHADGELTFDSSLIELKSMKPLRQHFIPKVAPDHPDKIAWVRDKAPDYYLQAQEYLRISGKARSIMVIVSLVHPFEMNEIHIPFDHLTAHKTAAKFRRVREAVAEGRPPYCECTKPQSKECGARDLCGL